MNIGNYYIGITELIAFASLIIALIALIYSIASNTKRYELTYQYYNDVLNWHNEVIETIMNLRACTKNNESKINHLSKLSALIETGRFYFPNVDKNDGFGNEKPPAYRGYRNIILDFLVFEYNIYSRANCEEYIEYDEVLQRLFTSFIFDYLKPEKHRKKVYKNTSISRVEETTINEFLSNPPEEYQKRCTEIIM